MNENRKHDSNAQDRTDRDWDLLYEIRQRVIQSVAKNMDLFGVTPSVGRLYGTMYFHGQPMTLDEMRDELGMSKTSMSTGVRSLQEIHMVYQTWKKGVRKDLYQAEEDWYKTFIELFTTKWRKAIEINSKEVSHAKGLLEHLWQNTHDENLKRIVAEDLEKLQHASEYYDWLSRLVESFETGEIFKFIPKKSEA